MYPLARAAAARAGTISTSRLRQTPIKRSFFLPSTASPLLALAQALTARSRDLLYCSVASLRL
eukprot:m.62811 g.62811  ORF g.62811 m.62811 type:complete len:63 (-) comp13934_c0_seq5:1031-1219(-)